MPVTIRRKVVCKSCSGRGARPGSRETTCVQCSGSGRTAARHGPFHQQMPCAACAGGGRAMPRDCPGCGGQGRRDRVDTIQVKIPCGIVDGTRLKVAGKGNDSSPGGGSGAGDLLVRVRVASHAVFERRGDHIYCKIPVTVPEAALGARIQVPTVDGSARLSVPPGTQSGQQLRLRGKGAPTRRGGRGDQIVEIEVLVPLVTNAETRALLQQLGEHIDEAPRAQLLGRSG